MFVLVDSSDLWFYMEFVLLDIAKHICFVGVLPSRYCIGQLVMTTILLYR